MPAPGTYVSLSVYITHPYRHDLYLELTGPDGTTVCSLINHQGGAGDNFGQGTADDQRLVLTDDATVSITTLSDSDPAVGEYRPEESLFAAYGAMDPLGTWTLRVYDNAPGDVGIVQAASLLITTVDADGNTANGRYDTAGTIGIPDNTWDTDGNAVGAVITFNVATLDVEPGTIGLVPRPAEPGFFRIKLTSLHHPAIVDPPQDAQPPRTLARFEDFTDAGVTIPINDQREATVTISMNEPACAAVKPYETLLHIVYATPNSAYLVFWGIVTQPVWNSEQETVTIPAVDMSLKLQNRQVRFGTRILNGSDDPDEPNPFNGAGSKRSTGHVPLDYVGIGWIRDAARNNQPQNDRGVPPLGITDGTNTADPLPLDTPYKIEARRGDTLWDVWQQIIGYQVAPDFELEPRDDTPGVYARLNTYSRQGHADPSRVVFHDGFGLDNCLITYQPGGKLVTDNHVLSTGDQARVTVNDEDAEATYGLYVQWDETDYPATDLAALHDLGQQTIDAYSTPPDYFLITPNLDCGLYYLDDFAIGDAMTAAIRRGQLKRVVTGDIRSVKLTQADEEGNVSIKLEAAVSVTRTTIDGGDV